jgi:plastocyanin
MIIFALLLVAAASAQTNHVINWGLSVPIQQFSIVINVGDSVTWVWADVSSNIPHTVTSGSLNSFDGKFTSSYFVSGNFSQTFNEVGVFPYYCVVHPILMSGNISVVISLSTTTSAPIIGRIIDWGIYANTSWFSQNISVGETVTWVWVDDDTNTHTVLHTVTSGQEMIADGIFDSGTPKRQGSFR